jgi:hypothetical protein
MLADPRKKPAHDLAAMNGALPTYDGTPNASQTRASLQQAVRILRAIRLRYEIDRIRNSDARPQSVNVALGHADMCWITAAIEALEQSLLMAPRILSQIEAQRPRDSA